VKDENGLCGIEFVFLNIPDTCQGVETLHKSMRHCSNDDDRRAEKNRNVHNAVKLERNHNGANETFH